jgi:hypothetical protein
MEITPLRKLLKESKKCNPFNNDYNREEMINLIKSTVSTNNLSEDPLRFTIGITDFMNRFYTQFYKILEEDILL